MVMEAKATDTQMRSVFEFSDRLWTRLLYLIPSYVLGHSSVCTSVLSCEKTAGK